MKTLVLWLDAFNEECIDPRETPYLYSLVQKFGVGKHKQIFGYSSVPASFMTGFYPKSHNQFTIYWHDPLAGIKDPLLNLLPSKIASYYFNLSRFFRGEDFFTPLMKTNRSFFSLAQKKYYHHHNALPVPTLFNHLDKKKKSFLAYNWPLLATNKRSRLTYFVKNNDKSKTNKFLSFIEKGRLNFYFLHLWDLDTVGHQFGLKSKKAKKILKQQDRLAKKIISYFSLKKDLILIWSDHGMLPVKGFVNLQEDLPENGDGFFYFLDSTMARFWFKNKAVKRRILEILSNIKEGHLLTTSEQKKFRIDFDHQKYGEEIFLLNPGFVLKPNFFQGEEMVKGMHGYDLSDRDEWGIFILNRDCRKSAETVDFLPTLLQELNLKITYPIEGKSLLS